MREREALFHNRAPSLDHGMDQLLRSAQRLELHGSYVLCAIGLGAVAAAWMVWAEIWGSARARRRSERVIAETQAAHANKIRT
jgi:hypothetical protein